MRQVEAKRAVPRAESLRDVGSSSLSSRGSGTNPISGTSVSSAVGTTKKIFVGGLHYETKDGTSCCDCAADGIDVRSLSPALC